MTDTKHAGTPRCPKCGSGEIFLFITECITRCPNCRAVYPTIKIADFMQFSPLAEENALRTNKLAEILRLEVDGEEFYIPAEPGPLGPFESLEEAAKEFMEFMDRTDKKMREENALLRKALEIIADGCSDPFKVARELMWAWQCETCETRYPEYVNGCPHCWEAGIRSSVRNKAALEVKP